MRDKILPRRLALSCAAALALSATAARGDDIPSWCQYSLADAPKTAPRFEDYAVPVARGTHAPRVDIGADRTARLFRTRLRDAARDGANFAGHYALGQWGCGTGCLNWGVVDLKTGRVVLDKAMFTLENERIDFSRDEDAERYARERHAVYDFGVQLYRADSTLLVTLGTPGGQDARDGIAYWNFTGRAFAPVAFYKAMSLCHRPKD